MEPGSACKCGLAKPEPRRCSFAEPPQAVALQPKRSWPEGESPIGRPIHSPSKMFTFKFLFHFLTAAAYQNCCSIVILRFKSAYMRQYILRFIFSAVFVLIGPWLIGQKFVQDTLEMHWKMQGKEGLLQLSCDFGYTDPKEGPKLYLHLPEDTRADEVSLKVLEWMPLPLPFVAQSGMDLKSSDVESALAYHYWSVRGRVRGFLTGPAVRQKDNEWQIPKRVALSYSLKPVLTAAKSTDKTLASSSVLASGDWLKVGVFQDGMYRLSYEFLQTHGLISGPVPSAEIRLYGNGGARLPEEIQESRPDDLLENAVQMNDGGDGSFGPGDFFMFYGQGTMRWEKEGQTYLHNRNVYTDTAYYFVTRRPGNGLRVSTGASKEGTPDYISSSSDAFALVEEETRNLIRSGRKWMGESFNFTNSYSYNMQLKQPVVGSEATVRFAAAARCVGCNTVMRYLANGEELGTVNIGQVSSNYAGNYTAESSAGYAYVLGSGNLTVQVERLSPLSGSEDQRAWLDFISVHYRRQLNLGDLPYQIRDAQASGLAEFRIAGGSSSTQVWDITDRSAISRIPLASGSGYGFFRVEDAEAKRFVVFQNTSFSEPVPFGKVQNQDLHGLIHNQPAPDMLVVAHPSLKTQAEALADLHRLEDGMLVHVVTTYEIYNEFSSGGLDVSAIRDYVRAYFEVHGEENGPRFLMLYGDGSFEYMPYKDRIEAPDHNLVPAYQTWDSKSRSGGSHSSDYFYVALSPNSISDGVVPSTAPVWLGVGRILVTTPQEAESYNRKIQRYMDDPACLGDWRNSITLFADDMEEGWEASFVNDNEEMYRFLRDNYPVWNVDKVYIDAFVQNNDAGQRYPEAKSYLNRRINRGTLFLNYIGHGGEAGLTAERVMQIDDIEGWENTHALPLFSTATCTFTRFDDPTFLSAGERVFLRENKGGIALISTVRAIPVVPNYLRKLTRVTFGDFDASDTRLGDILYESRKCNPVCDGGENNILLFGDPAMRLAYPRYLVLTDSVNGNALAQVGFNDTLKASDVVRLSGRVATRDSQLISSFNGSLYITVFDKPQQLKTLRNDAGGQNFAFELQNSVVFRGKVTVNEGLWSVAFKVPLDINYLVDSGKVSYYAENGVVDAHGYFRDFLIGGSSGNCLGDMDGPDIELFLNDSLFQDMGITHGNPEIFARLNDPSGINTAGGGIGHEIRLTIFGDESRSYNLNNYYEADLNSYTGGSLRFPLEDLAPGFYTVELQVWDGCNNVSRKELSFTVVGEDPRLIRVEAWPNPFHENTQITFQHNLEGRDLEAEIVISDLSGRQVRSFSWEGSPTGFQGIQLTWDGTSTSGEPVSAGLYAVRVMLRDETGEEVFGHGKIIFSGRTQ